MGGISFNLHTQQLLFLQRRVKETVSSVKPVVISIRSFYSSTAMSSVLQKKKDKVVNFHGPCVAAVTPFRQDGSIDESAVLPYAKYLIGNGVKGFYIHGTTGEGVSLSLDEKKALTKAWVTAIKTITTDIKSRLIGGQAEVVGGKGTTVATTIRDQSDLLLMINVSATCIKEVQEMARLCQQLDVDVIATLPPFYYKPADVDSLVKYMRQIWTAAPDVPLLYYHFPEITGVTLPLYDLLEAGTKSVPSFSAIKYTSEDIVEMNYIHFNFGDRINVFPGFEEALMAAFSLGMHSSICAQFNFAEDVRSFYDIFSNVSNNPKAAREAQIKLAKNARKYQDGNFIANIKAELSGRVDFSVGLPRSPIV